MRHLRGVDRNQSQLDKMAKQIGALAIDTTGDASIGFDRLYVWHGKTFIVEVKDGNRVPSQRKLTKQETKRKQEVEARGVHYHVVNNVVELLQMFGVEVNL